MKTYEVWLNECAEATVQANSAEEAAQIAFRDFQRIFTLDAIMTWEQWNDPAEPQNRENTP